MMNSTRRYEIIEVIGRGAQGMVYKCRKRVNESTGERTDFGELEKSTNLKFEYFAMKRVMASSIDEANDAIQELNRVIQLPKHGGIAKYCDLMLDQQEGMILVSIIMKLYDMDLDKLIRKTYIEEKSKLSNSEVMNYSIQLLSTLSFLHSAGVIHRDIKPSNIFVVVDSKKLVIGDFGLAKNLNALSFKSSCLGSPFYISPEIMDGLYDSKIDIFSLGCTLYNLSTGKQKMFYIEILKNKELLNKQVIKELQNFQRPEWFIDLVLNMISVSPKERFTAKKLLELFEKFKNHSHTSNRKVKKNFKLEIERISKNRSKQFENSLVVTLGPSKFSEKVIESILLFGNPKEVLITYPKISKILYSIIFSKRFLEKMYHINIRKIFKKESENNLEVLNQNSGKISLFNISRKYIISFFNLYLDSNLEKNDFESKFFRLISLKCYEGIHQFFRFKFRYFSVDKLKSSTIPTKDIEKFSPFQISRFGEESLMHYVARFNLIDLLDIIIKNFVHIYKFPKFAKLKKFNAFRFGKVMDKQNNFAFHVGVYFGNIEIVKRMFLIGGVEKLLSLQNLLYGQNGYHIASTVGNIEMMKFLFETAKSVGIHTKFINLGDKQGFTCLHLAARKNNYHMCKLLCVYGAKKDIRGPEGKYPYEFASNSSVIELLML